MPKSRRRPSAIAITGCVRDITSANKAPAIHADRHAKGGADPITPESIGAIPHLGQIKCFSDADAESAIDTFYSLMPNDSVAYGCVNMNVMGTTFTGGLHLIFLSKSDGNYGFVERNSYSDGNEGGDRVRKILLAGVWQPWEHFDPPLMIGPEYRTTERYLGKPVYVKMVDFGSLPNNTLKVVTFGDNTIRMISAHGIMGGGYVIPGCTGSSGYPEQEMQIFTGNGGNVGIFTHTDRSNIEAVIVAKYWKTTD